MSEFARLLKIVNRSHRIVIIGPPGSGKTMLAAKIQEARGLIVVNTDDFKSEKFDKVPQAILDSLPNTPLQIVIEGTQATRLLRYGAKTGRFFASLVIDLTNGATYNRNGGPAPKHRAQAKGLQTIFDDYNSIMAKNYPPFKYPKVINNLDPFTI